MLQTIKNAEVILGSGEHVILECEILNAFIGDKSTETVFALAEVVCGKHNEYLERRITNLEIIYGNKNYIISTASDDDGEIRAIVSYKESESEFDMQAFEEYEDMLYKASVNSANVFCNKKRTPFDNMLSNEQIALKNYHEWLELLKIDTKKGDVRPVFITNFFEHLQEVTRNEIVVELLKLDRQIFISATRDLFENNFPGTKVFVEKVWTVI